MKYLMNVEFAKAVQAGKVWQDLWQGASVSIQAPGRCAQLTELVTAT